MGHMLRPGVLRDLCGMSRRVLLDPRVTRWDLVPGVGCVCESIDWCLETYQLICIVSVWQAMLRDRFRKGEFALPFCSFKFFSGLWLGRISNDARGTKNTAEREIDAQRTSNSVFIILP